MRLRNGFVARDALGREVRTPAAPCRIVSLVPSETASVLALGAGTRLVGRTDYCAVIPEVRSIESVGGTKSVDVERVLALSPDLVLANQEENGEGAVRQLIEAGANVHVSFPCDLRGSAEYVAALAALLHVHGAPLVTEARAVAGRTRAVARGRAIVLIWKDPWMSVDGRTYASDVLDAVGLSNACAERARRYPLAADVARAAAVAAPGRDTRYPRLSLEEIGQRDPEHVLLPDEPYAFTPSDADELRAVVGRARFHFVRGEWLFWYGARMITAISELEAALEGGRG